MAAFLTVLTGKLRDKRIRIPETGLLIGRDESANVRLASKEVSRLHSKIFMDGPAYLVEDLESENGTFVNDQPIFRVELKPEDVLHIGPLQFRFTNETAQANLTSDEGVASWLSNSGEYDTYSVSDSTIIPGVPSRAEREAAAAAATATAQKEEPVDPIVAKASRIIREYWEEKNRL